MKKVVFSIYVDIPEDKLDNPGWFKEDGSQINTDKSREVKVKLRAFAGVLDLNKKEYAESIGANYILYENDDKYSLFCEMFKTKYPQISEYDIINFYKHWVMKELATEYDLVCYMDFDVICNTTEDIFEAHDNTKFACAESNEQAAHGKTYLHNYRHCIRNPATKYWNTHAMLSESGYDPKTDVYNTGIMIASKDVLNQLKYFDEFDEMLDMMTFLKNDPDSMYPKNIQRVFNYDNETVFAYKVVCNDVPIDYIAKEWHACVMKDGPLGGEKMYHMIGKEFERYFSV